MVQAKTICKVDNDMKIAKKTKTTLYKSKKAMWNVLREANGQLISVNNFAGNGWGNVFPMPRLTLSKVRFEVYMDDVRLNQASDYIVKDGTTNTTIHFTTSPDEGADLHVRTYTNVK